MTRVWSVRSGSFASPPRGAQTRRATGRKPGNDFAQVQKASGCSLAWPVSPRTWQSRAVGSLAAASPEGLRDAGGEPLLVDGVERDQRELSLSP